MIALIALIRAVDVGASNTSGSVASSDTAVIMVSREKGSRAPRADFGALVVCERWRALASTLAVSLCLAWLVRRH
jgi:hypothetical protein